MKKIFTCLILAVITAGTVMAQPPVMKWQNIFGGNSADVLVAPSKISLVDSDGNYLLGCTTTSTDGDMTCTHVGPIPTYEDQDAWLAKVDSLPHHKIWFECLETNAQEGFASLQHAIDSGYIMSGITSPDAITKATYDVWLVRLGTTGNVIWEKKFFGSGEDYGIFATPTANADGYLMVANSNSNDGDIQPDRGSPPWDRNRGGYDIWATRFDKNGNLLWHQLMGGSGNEYAASIRSAADGGLIILGTTNSNDQDVSGLHGGSDMWLVKLDPSGHIQWQKCLGGTANETAFDLEITDDGGYMLSGQTTSNDGDVTGNHATAASGATTDAWIVRLSPTGDILWQKCFGGSGNDALYDIIELPDHNFAAVGITNSSDGDVSQAFGSNDAWLVKFDAAGNLIWQKSFGTAGNEYGVTLGIQPGDNFIVAGQTYDYHQHPWLFKAGPDIAAGSLPITLLSFQATQSGNAVNVIWKTTEEINAQHFEVQRSADSKNFITIGTVQAGETSYQFKDNDPLTGYNYYRLKMVDKDAAYEYSSIVLVNIKTAADITSTLYPNPGNGHVTLTLQGLIQGNVSAQVLDLQGRVMLTKQFGYQHTTRFTTPVDASALPGGNYLLRTMVGDKVFVSKLLIE